MIRSPMIPNRGMPPGGVMSQPPAPTEGPMAAPFAGGGAPTMPQAPFSTGTAHGQAGNSPWYAKAPGAPMAAQSRPDAPMGGGGPPGGYGMNATPFQQNAMGGAPARPPGGGFASLTRR